MRHSPNRMRAGRPARRAFWLACPCPRGLDRSQFAQAAALFLAAVRLELADISPEIVDLFFVLDAGEDHFGARNLGPRVLDVFLEGRLVPGDARVLVGVAVVEAVGGAGLAAVEPVELGTHFVPGVLAA